MVDEGNDFVERVQAWLTSHEWDVHVDDDGPSDDGTVQLLLSPSDGPAPWPLVAVVRPGPSSIGLYSLLPREVEPDRRAEVAEALTRVNDGLVTGCAEMTWDDGDVRVRTDLELGGTSVSDADFDVLVSRLVSDNLDVASTYFDAIDAVASGESSAVDAVTAAEQD